MSRVCAVCGAGQGLGRAIARRFAREGFAVALLARRQEALDAMAAEIEADGGTARGFAADLTDEPGLRAALARVGDEMGPPEVLIYNASMFVGGPAMALPPAGFAAELSLDVTGALIAAQAVFPAMQAAGRGTIIFTGSRVAIKPEAGRRSPGLTAGKAALRALAIAVAPELAEAGIHLGTVTIDGSIKPGGPFDPALIAEEFWALHAEPQGSWTTERVFRGH
jgi:NAD(P)-dependent dehydrogenase (short-subunit alcohol dehydrogenase family)